MAKELLLFVKDNRNLNDLAADAKTYKAGDVVVVKDVGWPWSWRELSDPRVRIIRVLNLDRNGSIPFLVPEPETDPQNPNPLLQRRAFMFDLQSLLLTADFRAFLDDDRRTVPIYETALSLEQIAAVRVPRPTRRGEAQL